MLHVVIDYDSPERLEVQSSSPDFLREKVEDAIFLALGTEPFTIRTGSDWIIRELNARIMLHELPRPERDREVRRQVDHLRKTSPLRRVPCIGHGNHSPFSRQGDRQTERSVPGSLLRARKRT